MYTPHNIFYPELPKAQYGPPETNDGEDPVEGDTIKTPEGDIYVYSKLQDGTLGWVLQPNNQTSGNSAVVDQNPTAVPQNTDAPSGKPPIGTIVEAGGKPARITAYNPDGSPEVELLKNDDSSLLKGSQKDYTSDYNDLEAALSDPKVKEALWKEYQKNKTSYKIKGKGNSYKNVKDADELVKRFLKTQKAIMILNAKTSEKEFEDLKLDTNKENRDRILAEYGIDETDLTAFQKTFYDLKDLSIDDTLPKEVKTKLDQFNWTGAGPVDNDSQTTSNRKGAGNISNIDGIFGDDSSRQMATTKQKTPPPPPVKDCPPGQTRNPITGLCEKPTPPPPGKIGEKGKIPEVGWFPQDRNNLIGALTDWTGVKKYPPYMPTAEFAQMDPFFMDPSRELANTNEQINIGTQGLNAFGNPQGYMAGYTSLQGKAAPQSADILNRYQTANVNIANDAARYNADVKTKQALFNAQQTGNYHDQYAILNNQFDNAKRDAKNKTIAALNTGISNMAMANTMNYMHPYEYFLDPSDGGSIRLNRDNLPQSLDESYKSDYEKRSKQLEDIMQDKRWTGKDPLDIYKTLYPSEFSPGSYQKPKGQPNQQELMRYYQMMQQNMGAGYNPYG